MTSIAPAPLAELPDGGLVRYEDRGGERGPYCWSTRACSAAGSSHWQTADSCTTSGDPHGPSGLRRQPAPTPTPTPTLAGHATHCTGLIEVLGIGRAKRLSSVSRPIS